MSVAKIRLERKNGRIGCRSELSRRAEPGASIVGADLGTKTLSPVIGERALVFGTCFSVVQVGGGGCGLSEVARGANDLLAWIGPRKPGGHVPVQMVDRVGVFGVGLGEFAGEDRRLLLEPGRPQHFDRRSDGGAGRGRGNALVQRDLVCDVPPRPEVLL